MDREVPGDQRDKETLTSQTFRIQTMYDTADKMKIVDPWSVWFLEMKMGKTSERFKIHGALRKKVEYSKPF